MQSNEVVEVSIITKPPASSVSMLWSTCVLSILCSEPLQDLSSGALCELMTIAEY